SPAGPRQKPSVGGAFAPSYLKNAAQAVDAGTEFVLAMDLEDVTCPQRVKRRMDDGDFKSLAGKTAEGEAICQALASIKGLTLKVEIDNDAKGTGVIEFGRDASALDKIAKPL